MAQESNPEPQTGAVGIGGFFFRSEDPEALAQWYEDHLSIDQTPSSYEEEPWHQAAGPTVFEPFPAATEYFRNSDAQWMINFRVSDLDQLVTRLRDAGIEVDVDDTVYPNGRFAFLFDPEGNPIQLWQPM